jgi:type IV pilus assembly protein PilY1
MENADYIGNWNNFTVDNSTQIDKLFRLLGNDVSDYHNTSSNCAGKLGADGIVADGNSDDILGLIKFVRGYDYFAYEGCDNINKVRSSVLGDIYHSQLVEVGKPKANTFFTANNQEAYWRSINGYKNFALTHEQRKEVIYVGANDGMLHAFDSSKDGFGKELWAFVPPFIAARLPELINDALDGLPGGRGGTNAIFAVDGSPVVHDMFIRGLKSDGTWESPGQKSWHTILFITYGRGGNGFSVLDVTDPENPLHVFSLYNDKDRGKILVAKSNGEILNDDEAISEMIYKSGTYHVSESLEAQRASRNEQRARLADIAEDASGDDTTQRDLVAICQENSGASSGTFHINGTAACYKGKTFTFKFDIPDSVLDDLSTLIVESADTTMSVESFTQSGAFAIITFNAERVFNSSTGDETDLNSSDSFKIRLPAPGTEDQQYDYSKLGETWSNPRIIRLPVDDDPTNDIYTAVLPGGFGKANGVGSAVFLVNLSDMETSPGAMVSAGPIEIADLDTSRRSQEDPGIIIEPDIHNSILGDPVVITPDTFRGAKWRGAMVYINDLEGKITKINLTSDTKGRFGEDINLYDTTTLNYLNTTHKNGRLSYFGMDAAFGSDTKNLWLFGSTGDFSDIGGKDPFMDNIIYGIRDRDFPNFVHLGDSDLSNITMEDIEDGSVRNIDDETTCAHTHKAGIGDCLGETKDAWVFKLDQPYYGKESFGEEEVNTESMYRKASASPTVYKGTVYYPIYQPPSGAAACGVGNAFICSADDECGTNTSKNISYAQKTVGSESRFNSREEDAIGGGGAGSGCYYLQPGILSKLVVYGDTLFANITTSSEDQEDTLISLLSEAGEIEVYKGSWRENY